MRKTVLLLAAIVVGFGLANHSVDSECSSASVHAYVPHGQIAIFSDEDFTSDNGVAGGSGTSADPYIIEGWSIDISDVEPDGSNILTGGIHIGNTRAYFVVRNVLIQGDYEPVDTTGVVSINGNPAIVMYFGANARIENCVLKNTTCGVDIRDMANTVVLGNSITGNSRGVDIEESSQVLFEDNYVTDSQFGNARFLWISDSIIRNNTITGSDEWMGMDLYDSDRCEVVNNTISNNANIGLNVGFCRDCLIAGNTIADNEVGIEIYGDENVVLEDNSFSNNEEDVRGLSDGAPYLVLAIATSIVAVAAIVIATYMLLKKSEAKKPPN